MQFGVGMGTDAPARLVPAVTDGCKGHCVLFRHPTKLGKVGWAWSCERSTWTCDCFLEALRKLEGK